MDLSRRGDAEARLRLLFVPFLGLFFLGLIFFGLF